MSEASPGKILLATDGSEDADLAARVAAGVSVMTGREVHVVHVLEPLPRYAYPGITPEIYSLVDNERKQRAREMLARETEHLQNEGANVAEAHLREGSIVDEILDSGDEVRARFIMMGRISVEGRSLDPRLVDDALRRGERDLREHAEMLERVLGRRLRVQIAAGDPTTAILREAEGEKTLVAVGSHGLGPVRRMRLGSVSTKVLRAAEGPVLVYPHIV